MSEIIQIIFAVLALVLLFFPTILLAIAVYKVSKISNGFSLKLVAGGALLLTIASLDFLYGLVAALVLSSHELVAYTITVSWVFRALHYISLLCLGIGLLLFVKEFRKKE